MLSAFNELKTLLGFAEEDPLKTECADFQFRDLTVGQVASASSAAGGLGAVEPVVQGLIELARKKAKDAMNIFYCRIPQILVEAAVPQCNQRVVIEELNKFLGCRDDISKIKEDSSTTANRWVGFTRRLAIEMSVSTPLGNNDVGHTVADAGYNDNSGLGPILAQYLHDDADQAQILVLVINQFGDHQMNMYFDSKTVG